MALVEALILAAGSGTRVGGSKARLLVGGAPLVVLHARRAHEAGCERVVAVVRAEDEPWILRAGVAIDTVVSAAADAAGSLALGVAVLRASSVLVTPVDVLPASVATIAALGRALDGPVVAATPEYAGKGGHPVLVRSSVLDPYRGAAVPPALRTVLERLGARRAKVAVTDANVLADMNVPEDVVRWTGAAPAFFHESLLSNESSGEGPKSKR